MRILHEEDREEILRYVRKEPEMNLFLIGDLEISLLEKEDVAEAVDLLSCIEEFAKTFKKEEREEQIRRMSAMIVGVATAREYRGKGYASAVVQTLCRNCFDRGKKYLCLFYDNPAAGRIYHRIGFKALGEYGMLR